MQDHCAARAGHSYRLLATAGLCLFSSLPALAQGPSGSDEVERGKQLYMANGCFSCHGTVGQGGERSGAPKLAPEPYPFEAFKVLVRTPREAMPRLDARYVSDEQLRAIHVYLGSIQKGPGAKDIAALRVEAR